LHATIDVFLDYTVPSPCMALLQIACAKEAAQDVRTETLTLSEGITQHVIPGAEAIGTRTWLSLTSTLTCTYQAQVSVQRQQPDLPDCAALPMTQLPDTVVKYLMPSRYCPVDTFPDISQMFGAATGGALVQAFASWCQSEMTYDIAASDHSTTALHTFNARRGVCRDYAHLLITFCRLSGIPARMVSIYSPDADPPDFHAVAEVYLEGGWRLVDPTGMTTPDRMIRICVGRDAADIAFLTAFGVLNLTAQSVRVTTD